MKKKIKNTKSAAKPKKAVKAAQKSTSSVHSKMAQQRPMVTGPLTPLNDRVVVKPLSAEEMGTTTASGIIIPDSAKEKPEQGTVVAVGPGKYENGERVPINVSVGDRVMFSKYGFDEVKIAGQTYYVIGESNILAIIN